MKAENLKLEEFIDIAEGRIDFHGRRLVLHSINAFAQLRRDLIENIGEDQARQIFTRFGYFSGQADAAAMKRIFGWDNLTELLKAGPKMHSIMGIARMVTKTLDIEEKTNRFNMEVILYDSGEAEEHILEIGKSAGPVCWMMTGYASGFASFCLGYNVYFKETKCMAGGDEICYAVGRDELSWGDQIREIRTYFQAEDIKGKVQKLTETIKKKTTQLEKQKWKFKQLEHGGINGKDMFIEALSRTFQKALDIAYRVSRFESSVLITGETGTGKEVLARYIHRNSIRSTGKFVAINCAALPETLLESELFGHKAGSFTGAVRDRTGLFEEANNGTIFLDEIGDVSPAMQSRLLRVLQEKEIVRLGENIPRKINSRVIAATNRNLLNDVRDGKFREDLLYRIRVIEIEVPPLRERQDDILSLTRFFIKKLSKKMNLPKLRLDSTCADYLQNYSWPGNVRELENILERASVLTADQTIRPEHLTYSITHFSAADSVKYNPLLVTLNELEAGHIKKVLELSGQNRSKAAKALGISLATLWRKLKIYDKLPVDK